MIEQHRSAIGNLTPEGGWHQAERVRVSPLKPAEMSLFARTTIHIINAVGKLDASNLFMMLLVAARALTWMFPRPDSVPAVVFPVRDRTGASICSLAKSF